MPAPDPLPVEFIRRHVAESLAEDLGASGDLTARYFLPEGVAGRAVLVARGAGVLAGMGMAEEVFRQVDPRVAFTARGADGSDLQAGTVLAEVAGPVRGLVTAERTALNYLQHMSGIATLTRRFVDEVAGTGAAVLDTRKTTPGWRALEKYAVRCGGGTNHRMGLYDAVMVKDNHLACGLTGPGLQEAIREVKARHPGVWVEMEADTIDQVARFLELDGVERILLDNMGLDDMRAAVAMAAGRVSLEASGGVNIRTVRAIAETGVDFVSVGALTHSAAVLDLAMDFV